MPASARTGTCSWRDWRGIGRSLGDIEAVLLTHAHVDHIGMADRIRTEAPATVHIHEADRDYLVAGRRPPNAPDNSVGMGAALRHGFTYRLLWYFARHGALSTPIVAEASAFADGQVLDVPGQPRIVHVPGHTPGSAAILFDDRGVLCCGDAIVTLERGHGRDRPTPRAGCLLQRPVWRPGLAGAPRGPERRAHPARPWRAVPRHRRPTAVALAREADR